MWSVEAPFEVWLGLRRATGGQLAGRSAACRAGDCPLNFEEANQRKGQVEGYIPACLLEGGGVTACCHEFCRGA